MRTFSHLVPNDGETSKELLNYINGTIGPHQPVGKKDTKKSGKDLQFTTGSGRQLLQYASLLALRQLELGQISPQTLSV